MMVKRSFVLAGHATSVALEPEFWKVLETAAASRCLSLSAYIAEIDAERERANLASELRCRALAEAIAGNVPNPPVPH